MRIKVRKEKKINSQQNDSLSSNYMYIYMCVCVCACVCACIYMCMHIYMCVCIYIYICMYVCVKYVYKVSKVAERSRGWPEGSFFDSYDTNVEGMAQLLSLDCFTLPLIPTLYYWVLNKGASSTIFWVFAMTRPGIEPRYNVPLANTLTSMPMSGYIYIKENHWEADCLAANQILVIKIVSIAD